jgi:serine/threonine protein phosphatase PrpC
MKIRIYGMSQAGKGRRSNEDAFLAAPETGLFAVADGVGGNFSGELAAGTALAALKDFIARSSGDLPLARQVKDKALLASAVREANAKVRALAQSDEKYKDMACTLAAGVLSGDELLFAHLGDSRLYLVRGGLAEQLTSDHSWVNEQLAQGSITPDEAKTHKMRGAVTRAIGAEEAAAPDLSSLRLRPGDYLLFCTDGLSDAVQRAEIGDTVARLGPKIRKISEALADLAVAQGSADDITILILYAVK